MTQHSTYFNTTLERRKEQKRQCNRNRRAKWASVGQGEVSILDPKCAGWYQCSVQEYELYRNLGAYEPGTKVLINGQEVMF